MVFKENEITITQSIDREGLFFVLRPYGPDVVFKIWSNGTPRVIKGILTDKETEFIRNRILTHYINEQRN